MSDTQANHAENPNKGNPLYDIDLIMHSLSMIYDQGRISDKGMTTDGLVLVASSGLYLENSADSTCISNFLEKILVADSGLDCFKIMAHLETVANGNSAVTSLMNDSNKHYVTRYNALKYMRIVVQNTKNNLTSTLLASLDGIIKSDPSNLVASTAAHVLLDIGAVTDATAYYMQHRPKKFITPATYGGLSVCYIKQPKP